MPEKPAASVRRARVATWSQVVARVMTSNSMVSSPCHAHAHPPLSGRAIAYGYLFRHPERGRPKGGVVEGPFIIAEAIEKVPPLRLAALGSGRNDGSFCHMR